MVLSRSGDWGHIEPVQDLSLVSLAIVEMAVILPLGYVQSVQAPEAEGKALFVPQTNPLL